MSRLVAPYILRLADSGAIERVELEARLGPRRFASFFRMAWQHIDTSSLKWNWHIDLVCDEMEKVARRETLEMVICIPPRSLKSQIVSVAFPAWVWTWFPGAKFITASNDMTLATRDAVRTRRLVKSDWYQARWGPGSSFLEPLSDGRPHPGVSIETDQDNKTYYETTSGGHRFVCSPGTNVTGHGGDFVVVDDPHPVQKSESEVERRGVLTWWRETVSSRLNDQNYGAKLVVQQRTHHEDLAGDCIKRGYYKVVLPMEYEPDHPDLFERDPRTEKGQLLHPERTGPQALNRLKSSMGPYAISGQLQMRPVPREGGFFKRHWFHVIEAIEGKVIRRVRRWDLAGREKREGADPDWTCGVKMALLDDRRVVIEDVLRFQDEPDAVEAIIKSKARDDGRACTVWLPQDPGQAGLAQKKHLARALAPASVYFRPETGAKDVRAKPLQSQAAAGNVMMLRAPWNDAFLEELCSFPSGSHDDQVDAAAGAFVELFGGSTGLMDWMRRQLEDALP